MPHDTDNYTIGGMQFVFEGENFGNIVTGAISSDITYLDHFSAITGKNVKDRSLVQEISVTISLTLDEPTEALMRRFMLADNAGKVFDNLEITGAAVCHGVSTTGNQWSWDIPLCTLKPEGDFTFNSDDWSQFQLLVEVLSDSTEGYGILTHTGVNVSGNETPLQGT